MAATNSQEAYISRAYYAAGQRDALTHFGKHADALELDPQTAARRKFNISEAFNNLGKTGAAAFSPIPPPPRAPGLAEHVFHPSATPAAAPPEIKPIQPPAKPKSALTPLTSTLPSITPAAKLSEFHLRGVAPS